MLTTVNRLFEFITATTNNFFFGRRVEREAPPQVISKKRTFEEAFDTPAEDSDEQVRKRQKTMNADDCEEEEEVAFKVEDEEVVLKMEEEEVELKLEEDEGMEFKLEDGIELKQEDVLEGVEFKLEEEEEEED